MSKILLILCILLIPFRISAHLSERDDSILRVKGTHVIREVPGQIDFSIFLRYSGPGFKTTSDSL
jgi:hypothetical protein